MDDRSNGTISPETSATSMVQTEEISQHSATSTSSDRPSSSANRSGPKQPIDLNILQSDFHPVQFSPIKLKEAVGEAQLRRMVIDLGRQVDDRMSVVSGAFGELNQKVNNVIDAT